MKFLNPQVQRTARRIPILCAVYFVAFVFCFLFCLQRDVLAQVQYQLSEGTTVYHPLLGALLCTLLGTILGFFLNALLYWIPLRAKASAWFLPFMLTGLLTHWRFPVVGDTGTAPSWWVYALLLLGYGLWLGLWRMLLDSKKEREMFSTYAWPNALQLILMTLMTISLSNTDIVVHRTLRAVSLVEQRAYEDALQCARWETHPSRQLSVATALALSETNQMGNRLFAYPQPYGVSGLLPEPSDTMLFGKLHVSVSNHLGYKRGEHTHPLFFLQVIDGKPKAHPAVRNYLLSAYLLERRIDDFAQRLLLDDSLSLALPLHYREALILRQHLAPADSSLMLFDDSLNAEYLTFDSLRNATGTKEEREFRCRRHFGATYWYYYFFR